MHSVREPQQATRWTVAGSLRPWLLVALFLSLALFYRAGVLSAAFITQYSLFGLALFFAFAFLRPELALVFVPLTIPLYSIPLVLPNLRASLVSLQLHEVTLLVVVAATLIHEGALATWRRRVPARWQRLFRLATLRRLMPHALVLVTSVASVALAVERSQALRELRWFVVEPLLFYVLLRWGPAAQQSDEESGLAAGQILVLHGFLVAGAVIALVALLQSVGIDIVLPVFGWKETGGFTGNTVGAGSVVRVTSVYGHPNNLALALERVWPIAAVVGLAAWKATPRRTGAAIWFGATTLMCLAAIYVSFSRGAWLASFAAALVLVLPVVWHSRRWRVPTLVGGGVVLASLLLVAVLQRGDVAGGSTSVRLLLWREAATYLVQHPLGLGMGQFYFYHNPEFGRSLIDSALRNTSERFASHPHSMILDMLVRIGPLGLAAFVWLVVRFYRQGIALVRQQRSASTFVLGLIAAMTAAVVHGLADQFYFVADLAFVFWLLIGLMEAETTT